MLTAQALYGHMQALGGMPMVTVNLALNAVAAPQYEAEPEAARLFVPRTVMPRLASSGYALPSMRRPTTECRTLCSVRATTTSSMWTSTQQRKCWVDRSASRSYGITSPRGPRCSSRRTPPILGHRRSVSLL